MKNKVLIIDDKELDRKFISALINKDLNQVETASSVEEALHFLKNNDYSLILCDIKMPVKDGFDFVNTVNLNNDLNNVPIVFVTSSEQSDDLILRALKIGVFEILEKNKNIELLKKKIELFISIGNYRKELQRLNNSLVNEKSEGEDLLNKMLPERTIKQLKKNGKVKPRKFKMASVLFTDFVGFTNITKKMRPSELIEKLDFYFSAFDNIIESFAVEKIKTIGDSYMCVGGIPIRNKSNPIDTVLAAIKMNEFVENQKEIDLKEGNPIWEIRIGIHTGELIAGVIGKKKFAYDVWGDTVNVASRIESFTPPGTIAISETTEQYVNNYIDTQYIDEVSLKGVGNTKIFKVNRIKNHFSDNDIGTSHNLKLADKFYETTYGI